MLNFFASVFILNGNPGCFSCCSSFREFHFVLHYFVLIDLFALTIFTEIVDGLYFILYVYSISGAYTQLLVVNIFLKLFISDICKCPGLASTLALSFSCSDKSRI